jgi:hypothetical protein
VKDIAMTSPIATRTLRFQRRDGSEVEVGVTLGTPVPDPSDPARTWACPYEINGPVKHMIRAIYGVDSMQALILAIHALPAELHALARQEGGRFLDEDGLRIDDACRANLGLT